MKLFDTWMPSFRYTPVIMILLIAIAGCAAMAGSAAAASPTATEVWTYSQPTNMYDCDISPDAQFVAGGTSGRLIQNLLSGV